MMAHAQHTVVVDHPIDAVFAYLANGTNILRGRSAGSTGVTFTMNLKPRGLMVLMTAMLAQQLRSEVANLDNLGAVLKG